MFILRIILYSIFPILFVFENIDEVDDIAPPEIVGTINEKFESTNKAVAEVLDRSSVARTLDVGDAIQ